jgi:SNF2 family DNA or RNA helicase
MGLGKSLQALGLILTNGPSSADEPKTTLIVCPVSVMATWVKQVEQHVLPNTLKVGVYHGPRRFNLLSQLSELDILVTSYDTISKEFSSYSPSVPAGENHENNENEAPKAKPESSIFETLFRRIVLDEAHTIRNEKTKCHSGCMALQATYRLCVTGTPL